MPQAKEDRLSATVVGKKNSSMINFYAGTGKTQCKTYANTVMIPFSDRLSCC